MNLILSTKGKMASNLQIGLPLLVIAFCGFFPPIFAAENTVPGNFPTAKVEGKAESTSIVQLSKLDGDNHKQEKQVEQESIRVLKPDGGMQMWYYPCSRIFRYPIPTNFEFAYIDKQGKVVISAPFIRAQNFSNGVARVTLGRYARKDGKFYPVDDRAIDGRKALLFPNGIFKEVSKCDFLHDFCDELAVAHVSPKGPNTRFSDRFFELVDKEGKVVTHHEWSWARDYSEGLAAVRKPVPVKMTDGNGKSATLTLERFGYCDKAGTFVIQPQFAEAEKFSEGLAAVVLSESARPFSCDSNSPRFYHPNDYSYVDRTGRVVIAGPFMEARPFVNGLAAVMQDGKWGYVNKAGKLVVPCQYDWAGDFVGKLAPVEKNLLVGYIDATGREVIPFQFRDGREFSSGLAPVTIDAKKWGYIDESGKFAIDPCFQKAFPFSDERALVYVERRKAFLPEVQDVQALLVSAQVSRDLGYINDSRAACLAVVSLAPKSGSADSARKFLSTSLPDHDLAPEVEKLYLDGRKFVSSNKIQEAENCYLKALSLDPKFLLVTGALTYVYLEQNRIDDASKLLLDTLRKWPTYARGHWRLSQIYETQGKSEMAKKALARAIELEPDDPYFRN